VGRIGEPMREIEIQPLELPLPLQEPVPVEPVPIEEPVEVPEYVPVKVPSDR